MMKQFVMNAVQAVLPDEMINYLFKLAQLEPGAAIHTFRLSPGEMADCPRQDIEHTIYRSDYRQEYGVPCLYPISATISVHCDGSSYNMSLSDYKMTYPDRVARPQTAGVYST